LKLLEKLNKEILALGDALELDLVVVGAVGRPQQRARVLEVLGQRAALPRRRRNFFGFASSKLGNSSRARATCQFLARRRTPRHSFLFHFLKSHGTVS
jgi:hypothetical protein